jgi:hypothetical protein
MKCEMCNFQELPDNLEKLVIQAETCGRDICKPAKVVWREGQMTLTLEPQENEPEFKVEIRQVPPAPEPPIFVPRVVEPEVTVMVLETTNRNRKRTKEENDD